MGGPPNVAGLRKKTFPLSSLFMGFAVVEVVVVVVVIVNGQTTTSAICQVA